MRSKSGGDYQLFEAGQLTSAQHRATAESYAEEGNWTAAIRHRLRAVARQLEETGVLNPAPGRTANELARDAGSALPYLIGELAQAATAFNDVTYGEQPGTQASYQMIADLDDHLRSRSSAAPHDTGSAGHASIHGRRSGDDDRYSGASRIRHPRWRHRDGDRGAGWCSRWLRWQSSPASAPT